MNLAVIVIPVYKEALSNTEKISLAQVKSILGKYPIIFVAPERMRNFLSSKGCSAEFFLDENFVGTVSYSNMLLKPEFYERFLGYEYMLIYQLDAFVFSDRLKDFCDMGYDYIGAPWGISSNMYKCSRIFVGNGGLSLRHVSQTIRVLNENPDVVKNIRAKWGDSVGEDAFFAFFGAHAKYKYRVAPMKVAKKFSFEFDIHKSYKDLSSNLPFGCHAWQKRDFTVWAPIIEKFGYYLDGNWPEVRRNLQRTTAEYRQFNIFIYLADKFVRRGVRNPHLGRKVLDGLSCENLCVWGLGDVGKRIFALLELLEIPIKKFYASDRKKFNDSVVDSPDEILTEGALTIIVAIRDYWTAMRDMGYHNQYKVKLIPYDRFMWYIISCVMQNRKHRNADVYFTLEEANSLMEGKKYTGVAS